jgi:hypothetical protein
MHTPRVPRYVSFGFDFLHRCNEGPQGTCAPVHLAHIFLSKLAFADSDHCDQYVYICVCIYICIHMKYKHIYTIYTHINTNAYIHNALMHAYIHAYIHNTWIHTYIHTYVHGCQSRSENHWLQKKLITASHSFPFTATNGFSTVAPNICKVHTHARRHPFLAVHKHGQGNAPVPSPWLLCALLRAPALSFCLVPCKKLTCSKYPTYRSRKSLQPCVCCSQYMHAHVSPRVCCIPKQHRMANQMPQACISNIHT